MRADFVRLSAQAMGLLHAPDELGLASSVGVIFMHPNSNYLTHLGCRELAERGFRALGVNGRYFNTRRETMIWEQVPLDVKPAVKYLRELPGIKHVVLVGHSGGGQLMPFYQNVAENGVATTQAAERFSQGGSDLDALPAADGLVLLDAHHGYAANTLTSMDPAVVDEAYPSRIDPTLDVFNPDNGYNPASSRYSDAFKQRYFRAQAERMLQLTARAKERLAAIERGDGQYPDDEPFTLARGQARIWQLDTSVVSRTKGAYPILRSDGSTVIDVPRSVRVAGVTPGSGGEPGLTPRQNASWAQGAFPYSVRSWLSGNAIAVDPERYMASEDDVQGIDWRSSNTSTPMNLEGVRVPLLMMAMTGHYWMVPGEIFLQHAASADKELVFVEGASHNITPCAACEEYPGQYGDTVKRTFDHVAGWLMERFG
jgi:pimeloyl-ACP methyl ester carboxylesterase